MPSVLAWACHRLSSCWELGFPKRDTHKETFFLCQRGQLCAWAASFTPWLAYWEFVGWISPPEFPLRDSRGFFWQGFPSKDLKGQMFQLLEESMTLLAETVTLSYIRFRTIQDWPCLLQVSTVGWRSMNRSDSSQDTCCRWGSCSLIYWFVTAIYTCLPRPCQIHRWINSEGILRGLGKQTKWTEGNWDFALGLCLGFCPLLRIISTPSIHLGENKFFFPKSYYSSCINHVVLCSLR